MQFKDTKGRIQVLKYIGYDKDKKRAKVQMVGSLNRYSFEPTAGLFESLTADEKEELQSYIKEKRQSQEKERRQSAVENADYSLKRVADSLADDDITISPEKAARIWAEIEALTKAMKKAGHSKPKAKKAPPRVPPGQTSLIED